MQLERATSRSNEAALAGWISSNDATLFTMVLVLAIALFLFAQLSRGAREHSEVSQENVALAEQLGLATSELDASRSQLVESRGALHQSQQRQMQLQQQLVEKLDEISGLGAKLDVVLQEKGELESQRLALLEAKESLSSERASLMAQRAALVEDRDSLRTANVNLRERLEATGSQLEEKIAALQQLELQRDRLNEQADELDAIVAALRQRLSEVEIEVAESQERAAAARVASEAKIEGLQAELAESGQEAEEYLARLRRATALFEGLRVEKEQLQQALTEAEQQRQEELLAEARSHRQLLGLTGTLDRVAVLFDASGSMRQAGSGGGDRWAEAQEIAATWLQHLNVQQCVLIVFASDVRTFPEDGTLADVRGETGGASREALLQQLKTITPGGWTNTRDALRKAYEYDIDSIVLFSDGVPTSPDSGRFDPSVVQQIYELCRQRRDIPIHTVGLGNYFESNASTFLRSLANITGGTFRGR